jgi:hypothetical protein
MNRNSGSRSRFRILTIVDDDPNFRVGSPVVMATAPA